MGRAHGRGVIDSPGTRRASGTGTAAAGPLPPAKVEPEIPIPHPANITLSVSPWAGIIAIATGEHYDWATTALAQAGFHKRDDGTHVLPPNDQHDPNARVGTLVRCAERHQASVSFSTRHYIGDVAHEIAAQMPGQWKSAVEVYSHPVWPRDLLDWLWDKGELARIIREQSVPYAATLTSADGVTLLLMERHGHSSGYVAGALSPERLNENTDHTHAPRDLVLPDSPALAARLLADRLLPACRHALHTWRLTTVSAALDRLHQEFASFTAATDSRRFSDPPPSAEETTLSLADVFRDHAWNTFEDIFDTAPALLDSCRPARSPWPEDADILPMLREALHQGEEVRASWRSQLRTRRESPKGLAPPSAPLRRRHHEKVWPAIGVWLAHRDTFLRQARAATPPTRSPAVPARVPPALPARPGTPPHR